MFDRLGQIKIFLPKIGHIDNIGRICQVYNINIAIILKT